MYNDELAIELAYTDVIKMDLLLESTIELGECDPFFFEDKSQEKSEGLLSKLINSIHHLFETIMNWFSNHFGKGKQKAGKVEVSRQDIEDQKKIKSFTAKLKSGAKNPKTWAVLASAAAIVLGLKSHKQKKEIKKLNDRVTMDNKQYIALTDEWIQTNKDLNAATSEIDKLTREVQNVREQSDQRGKKWMKAEKELKQMKQNAKTTDNTSEKDTTSSGRFAKMDAEDEQATAREAARNKKATFSQKVSNSGSIKLARQILSGVSAAMHRTAESLKNVTLVEAGPVQSNTAPEYATRFAR